MTASALPLADLPAWRALLDHRRRWGKVHLRTLFAKDDDRFFRFSRTLPARTGSEPGLLFDFSKNLLDDDTLTLLLDLARCRGVETARAALFAGEAINWTEGRAVLHMALRNRGRQGFHPAGGADVMPEVKAALERMARFADTVRNGRHRGYGGHKIRAIVNIGIGGSHLGPEMICEALGHPDDGGPDVRFIANVDGSAFVDGVRGLKAEETLFIICSKTFTTRETMANAHSARAWFLQQGGGETDIRHHFVAVTSNLDAASAFGINPDNLFPMWDWVGGRYSWASTIGLVVACRFGFPVFSALLDGAHALDEHFSSSPLEENIPVLMALVGIWNRNFLGADSLAILPYCQRLHRFPAFLQQGEMESNGKRIDRWGRVVTQDTCPVIWGEPGTNGQHSFFQLLHQGTRAIPADFIGFVHPQTGEENHHAELMANFFAQSEALMRGRSEEEARAELEAAGLDEKNIAEQLPHRLFPGNRPSNTLLLDRLTPYSLGLLTALYEMKIFVQGVIWGVNSFDQWGVELGKTLAKRIRAEIDAGPEADLSHHDGSTRGLMDFYLSHRR